MEAFMHWRTRFAYEFTAGLGLYAALLVASIWAQVTWEPSGVLLIILALTPMAGCGAVLWAVMRAVQHMDELERRVQFEALAFAFVGTAFLTFAWGFAEGVGAPKLPAFGVWPIMAALWFAGGLVSSRRYR
ncbi:hypothetical protein NDN16_17635 [Aureimonas altamirensis]|uniref:hypothetical protein n=1 Tax=Aureimonas altamirensis TaxID=370622 RepID=UPI002036BD9D|nr:hypothetical protein [Aureimonas altamirensis]MCM2505492.1 hypothetical protein [Aureimonas altamirensis]